jgi:hypothetical protein
VKMNLFIFGFQRRVWCPKWTPLSRSWRVVTTAMAVFLSLPTLLRGWRAVIDAELFGTA